MVQIISGKTLKRKTQSNDASFSDFSYGLLLFDIIELNWNAVRESVHKYLYSVLSKRTIIFKPDYTAFLETVKS